MKRKKIWRWWAKALGEKPSKCDRESDTIAWIRTAIFISYLVTNVFIVAGVIRHWNDIEQTNGVTQMNLIDPQSKEEKTLQEVVNSLYEKLCEIEDYAKENKNYIDTVREDEIVNRNICNSVSNRVFELEQENIGTTNVLYQLENRLDMLRLEFDNYTGNTDV